MGWGAWWALWGVSWIHVAGGWGVVGCGTWLIGMWVSFAVVVLLSRVMWRRRAVWLPSLM
jgi:hypothetical protein